MFVHSAFLKRMKEKILAFIATLVLYILRWTCRYQLVFEHDADRIFFEENLKEIKPKRPFIIAFFHQDEICLLPHFAFTHLGVLVSISKDGEIMNGILNNLGFTTIRGSSSRKAVSGLIAAIRHVKNGHKFCLAVDGPKGPIYKVKDGIIAIQNKAQVPILPLRCKALKYWQSEKSWNKAIMPKPFSKVIIHLGKIDSYSQSSLEEKLNSLETHNGNSNN